MMVFPRSTSHRHAELVSASYFLAQCRTEKIKTLKQVQGDGVCK